jgi:hypothetical protein
VQSKGKYPTKSRTPVADVARYQNDGTEKISPSRFIERAESAANGWEREMNESQYQYMSGAGVDVLTNVAKKIARDIHLMCDRIRTGRLKMSFVGKVQNGRD